MRAAAGQARIGVLVGTERIVNGQPMIATLVLNRDGTVAGWQDKVQLDPSGNTCFIAAVNYAGDGSPTTSAVVRPDGTVLAWQPYGRRGLLIADIDLREATGLLASRFKPEAV